MVFYLLIIISLNITTNVHINQLDPIPDIVKRNAQSENTFINYEKMG